jgi:hypothetical protein
MSDQVAQDFGKICDTFKEMRDKMHGSQQYAGKADATDRLYEAIRQFAHEVGLAPPYLPLGDFAHDDWAHRG